MRHACVYSLHLLRQNHNSINSSSSSPINCWDWDRSLAIVRELVSIWTKKYKRVHIKPICPNKFWVVQHSLIGTGQITSNPYNKIAKDLYSIHLLYEFTKEILVFNK
jgi:hypothetical protein